MSLQSRPLRGTDSPHASSTTTITSTDASPSSSDSTATRGARLVLRAERPSTTSGDEPARAEKRIRWAEDVVNNEGMGKKSSKICCIYHKPRAVGESSDESSSNCSSDESDSGDDGAARPTKKGRHHHDHDHDEAHEHACHDRSGHDDVKGKSKKLPKNAYEKVPKT